MTGKHLLFTNWMNQTLMQIIYTLKNQALHLHRTCKDLVQRGA